MNLLRKIEKRRAMCGLVLAIVSFVLCFYFSGSLVKSAVLSACFVAAGCIRIRIPEAWKLPVTVAVLALAGIAALFLTQFVQNEGFGSFREGLAFRGFLCCLVIAFMIYLIVPDARVSLIVTIGATLLLATANWFVYRFRGSELFPIDFVSLGTAMNVANQYDFTITPNIVYAWVIFGWLAFSSFSLQVPKTSRKSVPFLLTLVISIGVFVGFFFTTRNMVAIHFGNGGTYYQGYLLNFTLSIKELIVPPPDGYSAESVESIMADYLNGEDSAAAGKTPNIIVIMDEAYADLGVLGDNFNTYEAVSPFIQSLHENTVKGYALSSAYGGRTANSEFEFLTGASLGFVPTGTVAYQHYIREETISLASILKSRGYDTVAMHPFLKTGWTRNTVWPNLGFDTCYFLDDFPQKNLMRGYVSDQEMMEYVINTFEQQDPSVPLFLFGVTMQNHSGYSYQGSDFRETTFLEGYSRDYPDANQYLTLIHETDKATEYLINHIAASNRETVVVFLEIICPHWTMPCMSRFMAAPLPPWTNRCCITKCLSLSGQIMILKNGRWTVPV